MRVDLVARARDAAEKALAEPLPRRWRHVKAVAAKAERVAAVLPDRERTALIAAAWLHDIGYAPDVAATGLHALDGARWLRDHGWAPEIAQLVGNHSCATYEADERGLGGELQDEFPEQASPLSDALWYADMTTGPEGQDLTVEDRLAEVEERYGPDHVVTRFWAKAKPAIMAAVRRTEDRLSEIDRQPI
jgi:putative nucleotidyltransferase with HDIG domain